MSAFDYTTAFSRNIGWVTDKDQQVLRAKKIAIGGMGGVGGSHLLTLTRLGIGNFHIADFDVFELANFNRQAGANIKNIQRPKVDAMAEAALEINPELNISRFTDGITPQNIGDFLEGVDLYVDGLDFFAVAARRMVFQACTQQAIPAITAAPLGMGTALLNFLPGKMTFEEYFRLEGLSENDQLFNFLVGLSPAMLQRGYLADPSTVNFKQHRGPSTPMACELCAGLAATEALKILLHRDNVRAAPHGLHFDAYRNKLSHTWRPGGNNNILQKLTAYLVKKRFNHAPPPPASHAQPQQSSTTIESILELARWAPSGDNTQPWHFEIDDESSLTVHGRDTRDHCVYDLQGHASQISLGILLETISIAASGHGLRTTCERDPEQPETKPAFRVSFTTDPTLTASPLIPFIPLRTVQRRAMRTTPLRTQDKVVLEQALPPGYKIIWLGSLRQKLSMARLMFLNSGLRLTMPEAYQVHSSVIEWNARYSLDKIPDQAIGSDPVTTRIMRWSMQHWDRIAFMNRYLAGTLLPRMQLDLIPAIACAAHFVLLAPRHTETIDDQVSSGRAIQRFWLTATKLGLNIQPEMTPLIFHRYATDKIQFSTTNGMSQRAKEISNRLEQIVSEEAADCAIFMGRIGFGPDPTSRSLRKPLEQLLTTPPSTKKQADT